MFIFIKSGSDGMSKNVFLKPFLTEVWICILFLCIAIGIVLKIVYFYENKIKIVKFIPSMVLLTVINGIGAFCQQGSANVPSTISGRSVHILLHLAAVIIYNYYTSIVVSILIDSPSGSSIDSITKLADSKMEIGIDPEPYTFSYIYVSLFLNNFFF